jgi:hypothetical protein
MLPFTGHDIGPLFIHRGQWDEGLQQRGDWTVTHAATGHAVHKGIKSKAKAVQLARQLSRIKCWDFTNAEQAKSIDPDYLRLIADIRSAA